MIIATGSIDNTVFREEREQYKKYGGYTKIFSDGRRETMIDKGWYPNVRYIDFQGAWHDIDNTAGKFDAIGTQVYVELVQFTNQVIEKMKH